MNNQQALTILKAYNAWRRQDNDYTPQDRLEMPHPKEIGQAIDVAIRAIQAATALASEGKLYTPWER